MQCPKCKTENREGRKFCAECGAALKLRCPECNSDNAPGEKFCGECGASLTSSEPSAVEPETVIAGERRHLTILFCDLVGSVAMTSQLDPEEWRATVASYQRAASAAISRFEGEVVRYVGDGIMAFFGYPIAHDNDAERASRAGLTILEAIASLNARRAGPRLSVRIGIDSGPVVIGVGAGQTIDAFGDAANIAARLQAIADADSVLISEGTHRLISGLFVVEDRGVHTLKGIERDVQVYRLVRPSGIRGRFEAAAAAGGLTPFVGREDELRSLLSRWERTVDGHGQVALIIGEAGIGKSRLMKRFHEQIAGTPHRWLEAGADAFFKNTPFHLVSELVRQLLGDEKNLEPYQQLETRLSTDGLNPVEAIPLIAPLLNLTPSIQYPAPSFSPEQQRRRLMATLVEWLVRATLVQPLVIVIEDLHWVDPSTLELIQLLVEQGATASLLLICTARPEFRPPWSSRAHHLQLTLDRLSTRDVRAMVSQVTTGQTLSEETVATVVERTGGVPLFIEELTRAVLEGGEDGLSGHYIPVTLHDSLMARLDRLGEAKEVIQIGAVLGSEFPYKLLQSVCLWSDQQLHQALQTLTDAELLYVRGIAPDANYQFKHALIRDAAYEALLKTRRKELHLAVARSVATEFPSIRETHPEVLARHWTEGGEHESAIAAWREAGDRASKREAHREAAQHYGAAISLLPTIDDVRRCALLFALGRAQSRAGESIAAHESLRDSGEVALRLGQPEMVSDAALELVRLTFTVGVPGEAAVQLLDRALTMVESTDSVLRARILSGLSTVLGVTGERERGIGFGELGVAMARRLGDPETLILNLNGLAYGLQEPDDLDQRLACMREALELARGQSERPSTEVVEQLAELQSHYCRALLEAGDAAGADAVFEAWEKIEGVRERPFPQSLMAGRRAARALMRGDFEQSQKMAETALNIGQLIRADNVAAGMFGLQMFALERERGRLKDLEPVVRLFVEQNTGAETWRPGLAVIYAELDRLEEARVQFEHLAADNFEAVPRDALWMGSMTFLADVCVFLGDKTRAAVLYNLLSRFDGRNVVIGYEVVCYGALSRFLGCLAATLEHWETAVHHFEDALAMNARIEAWTWLAHTQFQYAKMLLARGQSMDRDRAFALLDAAISTARNLGMRSLEKRADMLRTVGN